QETEIAAASRHATPHDKALRRKAGCWRACWQQRWHNNSSNPPVHFPPGAINCERKNYTHSAWSRFRMTLWALRGAVLGDGTWRVISTEENMHRLQDSPRSRTPQKPFACAVFQHFLF